MLYALLNGGTKAFIGSMFRGACTAYSPVQFVIKNERWDGEKDSFAEKVLGNIAISGVKVTRSRPHGRVS